MGDIETVFAAVQASDWDGLERLVIEDPIRASLRNEDGISVLMMVVYHRQPEVAAQLRPHIETLNIHEAAALGEFDTVARCVETDAELVHSRSPDGFTPLHLAAFFAHPQLVTALLGRGAVVDAVAANPSKVQPLHSATAGGCDECVAALLGAGADASATQQGGFTPLMAAAAAGSEPMVRQLLAHGASAQATAEDGSTARSLAESRGHSGVLALLETGSGA